MGHYLFEAELRAPLIAELPGLHLDALLAAAVYAETGLIKDAACARTGITSSKVAGFQLYHASAMFLSPGASLDIETIGRRRRSAEMGPDFYQGKPIRAPKATSKKPNPWYVEQGKGPYLALFNHYRTIYSPKLFWFAETEAPEEVVRLLRSLGWVGKRRGQGFGELGAVTYRSVTGESPLISLEGQPRRVIPEEVYTELCRAAGIAPTSRVYRALMSNYAVSGWENPPRMCVFPGSVELDTDRLLAASSGDDDFFG